MKPARPPSSPALTVSPGAAPAPAVPAAPAAPAAAAPAAAAPAAAARRSPSTVVYPKRGRYHHRYLHEAAVKRGLEVIAARGPAALTLRGIARDLGVTAAALSRRYGNLEGFRQAVAEEIGARLSPHARMNARVEAAPALLVQNGLRWIEFAAEHPNWYAFATSLAWRRRPPGRRGAFTTFAPAHTCMVTTRRSVQGGWGGGPREPATPRPDRGAKAAQAGASAYAGIHGLAMATVEGHLPREHAMPLLVALAALAA